MFYVSCQWGVIFLAVTLSLPEKKAEQPVRRLNPQSTTANRTGEDSLKR
jgi:hypothetical protein